MKSLRSLDPKELVGKRALFRVTDQVEYRFRITAAEYDRFGLCLSFDREEVRYRILGETRWRVIEGNRRVLSLRINAKYEVKASRRCVRIYSRIPRDCKWKVVTIA